MTQDNGARALSDREREHGEVHGWWRCIPISDAYLYLPDAAELRAGINKALAYLGDGSHERPGDLSIIAALATLRSLRAALAPEGSALREALDDHHPSCCGSCDECLRICWGYHGPERLSPDRLTPP